MATSNVARDTPSELYKSQVLVMNSNEQEFSYLWRRGRVMLFCVNVSSTPRPWGRSSLWAVLVTVHFFKTLLCSLVIHYIYTNDEFISQELHFISFTSCFWCIIYLQQRHNLRLFKFYPSFGFHFKSYLRHKIFLILSFDPILPTPLHQRQTKQLDKTTPAPELS